MFRRSRWWLLLLAFFVIFGLLGLRIQIRTSAPVPRLFVETVTPGAPMPESPQMGGSCRAMLVGRATASPPSLEQLAKAHCQVRSGTIGVGDSYLWSFDENDKLIQIFVLESVAGDVATYSGGTVVVGQPVVGQIGRDKRVLFYVLAADENTQAITVLRFSEENDVGYEYVLQRYPSGVTLSAIETMGRGPAPYGRLNFFSSGQCVQGLMPHGEVGSATLTGFGDGWGTFYLGNVSIGEKIYPAEGSSDPIGYVIATTENGVVALMVVDFTACGGDAQKQVI